MEQAPSKALALKTNPLKGQWAEKQAAGVSGEG